MEVEEQLADVIELDAFRRERKDRSDIVVALDDALYAFLPHDRHHVRLPGGRWLRYVRRGGTAFDLEIGEYVPTSPSHRFFFQTLDHLYEIDESGRVHRNGEIVWSEPLAAFGIPRLWLPGQFRVGYEAALLFTSREEDGWNFRVVVTDSVLLSGRHPSLPRRVVPRGWLDAATNALPRRSSGGADQRSGLSVRETTGRQVNP